MSTACEERPQKAPETVETVICGATDEHGGTYEWTCVLAPHGPRINHYRKAFRKPEVA